VNAERGEIWIVEPDLPALGSEMQKARPCVVVQPPEMQRLRTRLIVPLTSRGFDAPFRVKTTFGTSAFALCDRVRAVDRDRLRRYAGTMKPQELAEVLRTLQSIFTL
jgi:mRNA interferase MazF